MEIPMEYKINCDGGSRGNPGPAASAFVVTNLDGSEIYKEGFYLGVTTNNQAEYSAVHKALEWIFAAPVKNSSVYRFYLDSLLVVNQLNGIYKVKDPLIREKVIVIFKLLSDLGQKNITCHFNYVPRAQNSSADLLVNTTLDKVLEK